MTKLHLNSKLTTKKLKLAKSLAMDLNDKTTCVLINVGSLTTNQL